MPCRTDDYDTAPNLAETENQRLKSELDLTTRLLCQIMTASENSDDELNNAFQSKELKKWWKAHQAADKARLKAEEEKKKKKVADLERKVSEAKKMAKNLEDQLAGLKK